MERDNPIKSEVDFNAEGKHSGYLRLPHSVHRSAYGWIPIPVISLKNGEGPKVILMAGNHGDEYEGQIALSNLAKSLRLEEVRGQIIILPAVNTPAAIAGLRTSPIDGGNLNRCFPGNPSGSPTSVLAHYLESYLFEGLDLLLDLHSGGSSMVYQPSTLLARGPENKDRQRRIEVANQLGLPNTLIFMREDAGPYSTSGATRKGALSVTTELGGGGTVQQEVLQMIEEALPRVLKWFGSCPNIQTVAPRHETLFHKLDPSKHYVFARSQGLVELLARPGDEVQAGQTAARIHRPEEPWQYPVELAFEGTGRVLAARMPGRVEIGDCLFELGEPGHAEDF